MIGQVNPLQVSRFLQVYDTAAAKKGIKLSIGFDFHKYVSITGLTPTKKRTSISFQPDRSPITPGDGFWMIGLDQYNDVAVLQAVRLYRLSRTNFAEHLVEMFSAEPVAHAHQDHCTCTASSAKKMIGKVAYHGDGWVRKDYRGQGIPRIMAGIVFGVSLAMWAPDYICALVARWSLDKGVVAQYGYAHHEAGGLRFFEENVLNDNLLIWLTGEELRSHVDRINPQDSRRFETI